MPKLVFYCSKLQKVEIPIRLELSKLVVHEGEECDIPMICLNKGGGKYFGEILLGYPQLKSFRDQINEFLKKGYVEYKPRPKRTVKQLKSQVAFAKASYNRYGKRKTTQPL